MADRAEARYAAIVGERELEAGTVTLRRLRTDSRKTSTPRGLGGSGAEKER